VIFKILPAATLWREASPCFHSHITNDTFVPRVKKDVQRRDALADASTLFRLRAVIPSSAAPSASGAAAPTCDLDFDTVDHAAGFVVACTSAPEQA